MKIYYRPAAVEDIQSACEYIENTLKNPTAAKALKNRLLHSVSLLRENPRMGVLLKSKYEDAEVDYRFITVSKQLIFYEIGDGIIEIVRILDGRTDYLARLLDE